VCVGVGRAVAVGLAGAVEGAPVEAGAELPRGGAAFVVVGRVVVGLADGESGDELDATGETLAGTPVLGSSGVASPDEEDLSLPTGDVGSEPPSEPPDSAATENIASAPATATVPMPYTAARCRPRRERRAALRRSSARRAARPPPGGGGPYRSSSTIGGSWAVSVTAGSASRSAGVPHPGHE